MWHKSSDFKIEFIKKNEDKIKDIKQNKSFMSELAEKINSIEKVNDSSINFIKCFIYYNYDKWSKDCWFGNSYNGTKPSFKQDVKISVGKAKISSLLNKYEDFLTLEKIKIDIFYLKEDKLDSKMDAVNKNETNNMNTLNLTAIEPKYSFNQLIINEEIENEIKSCVKLVKNRKKIYEEWGFSKIDKVPHSTINFFGPPGTGKTMSAHILAAELGLKILPLNYADIESKYVGDAPKNLVSAFNIAEEQNALLFFDEADSFLGKRVTNVNSSSDQAVNSLRSQLLILLENRDVVTVFATNLVENYDSAFNSRILKHIKFELPNFDSRKKIISMMIPEEVPFSNELRTDEFFSELSTIADGLAPREIKNAILNTLVSNSDKDQLIQGDFIEEFKTTKIKFEEINKKSKKRKEILSKKITESLENHDYNVVKKEEQEEE